jgi:hypothetical protein
VTDRLSPRTLAAAAGVLAVIAFAVIVTRSSPGDRLSKSVDRAVARADVLEAELDAVAARLPSTTAPPPTFLPTTTTSTSLVLAPTVPTTTTPPSVVLTPASRAQIEAVVTSGAWDFQLPLPAEGLAAAGFSPSKNGGTLSYTVPAPAADTAAFFRTQLASRGFVFTEQHAGDQYTFLLGGQGQILAGPAGASTTTLTVTISL